MFKKSIAVLAATISMANAMDSATPSKLTKLPDEILIGCLSLACDGGLDLKTLCNEMLVCKKWVELAPQSVNIFDFIDLRQKSKYRHITLMANMTHDFPVNRYPNLRLLLLDFHSEPGALLELSEKLQFPEKRNFTNCTSLNSVDLKLNAIDAEIMGFYSQIHTLFYKPVLGPIGPHLSMNQIRNIHTAMQQAQLDRPKQSAAIDKFSLDIKKKNNILYSMTSNRNQDRWINDWILAQKSMVSFLLNFQNITNLTLVAWDQANLNFITQMPHLKILTLTGHPGHVLDPLSALFLDGLGQMENPHSLEELTLDGRLHLTNFDGWSKFEHLKKLSLPIKFFEKGTEAGEEGIRIQDPEKIDELLGSLVVNLPLLESLGISYRLDPRVNITSWVGQLPHLKCLNLSSCLINNDDLDQIAVLTNLKKVHLDNIVDSQWEFWRAHMHSDVKRYLSVLLHEDIIPCEKYTTSGLELFRERRPDINVNITDDEM